MYADFFSERLSSLREQQGMSARRMSEFLGQNPSYINQIENKKAFPTMQIFFNICEQLSVTPGQFFDMESKNPAQLGELVEKLKKLDSKALASLSVVVDEMLR